MKAAKLGVVLFGVLLITAAIAIAINFFIQPPLFEIIINSL